MPERRNALLSQSPKWIAGLAFVAWCWLAMMIVHEGGHLLAAQATGGQVTNVVLHPLRISRTDLSLNPQPLLVAWMGPLCGAWLPVLAWAAWRATRLPGVHYARFFAGFCLIANGAYLGAGSLEGVGDAGQLLRHGAWPASLWLFAACCIPLGLWLWHGQGPAFGWGSAGRRVAWIEAAWISGLLILTITLQIVASELAQLL